MTLYDDHVESRELLRSFMALALLPVDHIHEGYELLKQKTLICDHKEQLESFVSYFNNEWINGFHPSTWSVNRKA